MNAFFYEMFEKALKEKSPPSVDIMDIDHFKKINDSRGHAEGDLCLQTSGRVLLKIKNENLFCARYGAEMFSVLNHVNEMMQNEVKEGKCLNMSVSHGCVVRMPASQDTEWKFFKEADACLYEAKSFHAGKIRMEN